METAPARWPAGSASTGSGSTSSRPGSWPRTWGSGSSPPPRVGPARTWTPGTPSGGSPGSSPSWCPGTRSTSRAGGWRSTGRPRSEPARPSRARTPQERVTSAVPAATAAPASTRIRSTVPAVALRISNSIVIASSSATTAPAATAAPIRTRTSTTVASRGRRGQWRPRRDRRPPRPRRPDGRFARSPPRALPTAPGVPGPSPRGCPGRSRSGPGAPPWARTLPNSESYSAGTVSPASTLKSSRTPGPSGGVSAVIVPGPGR